MTDDFEDYEAEAFETDGREARLLPDEREALEEALRSSVEIFRAPGESEPDCVLRAAETLEELHDYFPDTRVSDGIGQVIEFLHEILGERVLDFEDAQEGKRAVEVIADLVGIEVSWDEV